MWGPILHSRKIYCIADSDSIVILGPTQSLFMFFVSYQTHLCRECVTIGRKWESEDRLKVVVYRFALQYPVKLTWELFMVWNNQNMIQVFMEIVNTWAKKKEKKHDVCFVCKITLGELLAARTFDPLGSGEQANNAWWSVNVRRVAQAQFADRGQWKPGWRNRLLPSSGRWKVEAGIHMRAGREKVLSQSWWGLWVHP